MSMQDLLNSTNKRCEIVKSALDLFAHKGYDGTTIKDIAKAAGVTDGAMYRHFPSKENLARVIFETLIGDYSKDIRAVLDEDKDLQSRVRNIVRLTYQYYESYPAAVCFALKSQHNFWDSLSEIITHPHLLFNELISDGLEGGDIKPQGNMLVLSGIFTGALMEPLTFHFYLVKNAGNLTSMADEVALRIIKMLA